MRYNVLCMGPKLLWAAVNHGLIEGYFSDFFVSSWQAWQFGRTFLEDNLT